MQHPSLPSPLRLGQRTLGNRLQGWLGGSATKPQDQQPGVKEGLVTPLDFSLPGGWRV